MSYFVISHLDIFTNYLGSHDPFRVVVVHMKRSISNDRTFAPFIFSSQNTIKCLIYEREIICLTRSFLEQNRLGGIINFLEYEHNS